MAYHAGAHAVPTTSPRLSRTVAALAPALVGLAGFLLAVGPYVLDPTNTSWLRDEGDSMQHYLGWAFFRHGPWTWPLGLNPNFGLELGASILYSDSVPLFAFLFKPFSPWLTEPFQYLGIWLLVAFVLQATFAWKLVGLLTPDARLRLAACALFVFAPPALFRLAGHWALVAHWEILAAIHLSLRPARVRQALYWALLTSCAALTHMYLFFMVGALWSGALLGDLVLRRRRVPALALELVLVPASFLFALWQAGLFAVGEGKSSGGFGDFRMNLNAPVNAFGWSYVLPTLDWRMPEYEGFMFLGLGVLLLGAAALPVTVVRLARGELRPRREWIPFGLVLAGLTVLALSNKVGLGVRDLVTYPVPHVLDAPLNMMRASGRLFWPVFYAILLGIVAAVVRGYRARVSFALLVAAVLLQVIDTSAGWGEHLKRFHRRRAVHSPMTSAFWYEAPKAYRRVRVVPPGNILENWAIIADYAQRLGLGTDAVYLARIDSGRMRDLVRRTDAMLDRGVFDDGTFYIMQAGTARAAPCVIDPERDQLALVDGFWVLMPGWKTRFGDRFAGAERLRCPVLAPGAPDVEVVKGADGAAVLTRGWSMPEPWGTWSEGSESVLSVRVAPQVSAVELALTHADRPGPPLQVGVSVDGQPAGTWTMGGEDGPRWYRVPLPGPASLEERRHWITLTYSDTRSPASLGASSDRRRIAVAVWRVRAGSALGEPAPQAPARRDRNR